MDFFKNLFELTRGYSLLMTLASCLALFSFAHFMDGFSYCEFALLVLALCALQLCANLYDDYRDVISQIKSGKKLEEVSFQGFRPKARLIINKTFSLNRVRFILAILSLFAIATGIYFILKTDLTILIYMISGAILIALYPISSKYNLAEIIVGLAFGPLMIMGGDYALCRDFDPHLFLLSIAIFFTTIVLLHTHSIMDWEFDIQNGKKTLALLTGSKENAIKVLQLLIAIPYIIILAGVLLGELNPSMLFVFLTLPMTTKLVSSMKEYIAVKDVKFEPRWYWGFFENWNIIKERKLEFFMFRFYLARNYSFFFALIAAIGVIK